MIASLDQYIEAVKQPCSLTKTGSRTTVAQGWFSAFDLAGNPGGGTLAAGNTANGILPVDTNAGYPTINTFAGGALGYIGKVEFGSTVACRIALFDRLFVAGAYAFNAVTALTAQPSFSGRVPDTDYKGLELWVEQVTAATGNQAVNVTYTNDSGATGRTTGAVGIGAAPTVGRCWQLPLQTGDKGVQQVTQVAGSVATAGTFNVMVLRRLWSGRVLSAGYGDIHDLLKTGMRRIFDSTALYCLVAPDSTALGVPDLSIEVVSG
jgi:hypothetical protein